MATDKTLAVRLMANVMQYKAAMLDAVQVTDKAKLAMQDVGRASDEHLKTIGTGALIAGGALAVGLGFAVKTAMDFDKELSNLAAVSGATGSEMGDLREAIMDAGQASVFSSSEAAKAASELAKAGISTQDILGGGLTGALNLAAAGNLDLAKAAEIAANGMTTFKLSGADVPRIADALAAGANKSAADVDDMGIALQQAGLVADQTGLTMEETVGTLSMFAQAGLKGSDAGTSLKTALMRLNPSTEQAANTMARLGLDFYDAEGNFIGITAASEQLHTVLGGLDQQTRQTALSTIFGQDAIRAATILYEQGGQGVTDWTTAVSDSGYAAELAQQKTDNLAGDLERLKGSIENALIDSGSMATDVLRGMAGGVETVVEGFNAMPGPLQGTAVGFAGIASAGLLTVGTVGTLIPKVREVKNALEGLGSIGPMIARNMGSIAAGTAIASAGLIGLAFVWGEHAKKAAEAAELADRFKQALQELTKTGEDNRDKIIAEELANSKAAGALEKHADAVGVINRAITDGQPGLSHMISLYAASEGRVDQWADAMRNGSQAGDEFVQSIIAMIDAGNLDSGGLLDLLTKTRELNNAHGTGSDAARRQALFERENAEANRDGADAAGEHGDAQGDMGVKVDETTGKIEEQKTELRKYQDRLKELFNPYFAFMNAQDRLAESQDELTAAQLEYLAAVQAHGEGSFEAAEALDKLNDAQRGVWESTVDAESAMADLADQVSTGKTTYQEAATKIDGMATSMGLSKEQADQMKLALFYATVQAQEFDGDYQARLAIQNYDDVYSKLTALIALGKTFAEAWRIAVPEAPEGVKPFAGNSGGADNNPFTPQADGGIMMFAGGGMVENHVAQIAPAGAMRLWAEPETGGEAYIPLSPAKRARSLAVWEQTGRMLGAVGPAPVAASNVASSVVDRSDHRTFNVTVAVPKGTDVNNPKRLARQLAPDLVREMARLEGSTS